MTSERDEAERIARNESAFRAINERVEELVAGTDDPQFVCECARLACAERLRLSIGEYEAVRSHPRRFVVVAGHEQREFERVIDQGDGWLVVEKIGEAGREAAKRDPRDD